MKTADFMEDSDEDEEQINTFEERNYKPIIEPQDFQTVPSNPASILKNSTNMAAKNKQTKSAKKLQ